MKIQCDACECSVAVLICCADEAALCLDCDRRVHAANKLAIKHQRVPLIPAPSKLPRCDICQEKPALIFCLEDRALLCRNCDVSIHSSNTLASGHQRFLATGIRIALNAACPVETAIAEETPEDPHSQSSGITFKGSLKGVSGVSSGINAMTLPRVGGFVEATKALNIATAENEAIFAGSTKLNDVAESPPGEGAIWQIDDVLSSPAFAVGYGIGDIVSSKADIPNIGDYHWMADMTVFDEQVYSESPGEVPQVPCYPTATEWSRPGKLNTALKGKMKYDMVPAAEIDDTFMVPDLGHLSEQLPLPPNKRRRSLLEV